MRVAFSGLLISGWVLAACVVGAVEASFETLPVKVVLFPVQEAVLAARIDGVIEKQNFKSGERFRAGDPLLKLEDERLIHENKRAVAQRDEAAHNAAFARDQLESARKLYKNDLQSEIDFKRRELELQVADSRLRAAEAAVGETAMQLRFATVSAPFSGRVEQIFTRDYETVRTGQPLLSILCDDQLLAVMNLPAAMLPLLKVGMPARCSVKETRSIVNGTIEQIAPRADHRSETVEIKVRLDNPRHTLSAGMSGVLLSCGEIVFKGREQDGI